MPQAVGLRRALRAPGPAPIRYAELGERSGLLGAALGVWDRTVVDGSARCASRSRPLTPHRAP
ncbi:hypothetical protein [Streptomyces sp. NPDC056707]|uniref:hypothetical protein n=1 Tax=Streptomyces sp. NPDC056707 TaxID=3345919 RepID=UPI0036A4D98F